ncbi:MFS transporter [Alicyclobacillus sp. SP_1]|uniref:MFS transporter n=1 Tax=Alicyclobacillus sp. SP_1 TaxID=2942475 RepID=UPI0021585101|nr:MFS transporter [Alicyclobacillus sp. SP_1]
MRERRALALYLGSETLLSLGIGMVQYAQPFFYEAHAVGDARIGILFSVNALTGAFVALLLAPLADKLGASVAWKFATLLLAVSYLGMGLMHSYPWWLVTSAFAGAGGALLVSTENVVLSSLTSGTEKAHIFSRFVAMYMFCMGSGSVLAGFLAPHIGFRAVVLMGAAISLIAPCIRVFVRAPDAKSHRAFRVPNRKMLWMSGFSLLFGMAPGLLSQFATLVLKNDYGASTEWTAIVSALAMFMVSVGSATVSPLIRKIRQGPTLAIAFATTAGATAAQSFTPRFFPFAGLYLLRTASASIPQPIIDAAFLRNMEATEFSQMFGLRVFGANVGSAIGTAIGGNLLAHRQLKALLWLSASLFVLAFVYITVLLRIVRRWPPPLDPLKMPQ